MIKKSLYLLLVFVLPLSALSQTGTIEGTVYLQSTGNPLTGAEVHVVETNQHQTTDVDGKFLFTNIDPGTYTVSINYKKYTTPTKSVIEVKADEITQLKLFLKEVIELETVVVEERRLPPTVSLKEIRGSELLRIPGTANDVLRGLTTLPSIGIPNDLFGILYIRGSEPDSNLYYFDRTPLGYPFHGGGLLSTISAEIIEGVDIYAGGYGAQFGLDAQSVIDIHSRKSLDKKWRGKFNLNLLYSEGLLEDRIGEKGYAYATARRSYFDLIAGMFIDQQLPYFSDYQLKFTQMFGKDHLLSLSAFAAFDHFNIVGEGTTISQEERGTEIAHVKIWVPSAYFKNGFEGQGIHLNSNFSDNLSSHFSLTRSLNFLNIDFRNPVEVKQEGAINLPDDPVTLRARFDSYNVKVSVPVYTLREDMTLRLNPRFQLEPGFLFSYSPAISFEDSRTPQCETLGTIRTVIQGVDTTEDGKTVGEFGRTETKANRKLVDVIEKHDEFGHDFF